MSGKDQNSDLVPAQKDKMISPAGTIDEAVAEFKRYQQLKERLATDNDFQEIGGKKHPKKSFVRKVQRYFLLSCEVIRDEPLTGQDGDIIAWLATARASHKGTGAFQEADGSCSMDEKIHTKDDGTVDDSQATIHNIRAHAITRAKNRAILDLVGFGEVSAEEIHEGGLDKQPERTEEIPTLPYGKSKDEKITDAPTGDLKWFLGTLDEQKLNHPKWGDSNRALKRAIEKELARRESGDTDSEVEWETEGMTREQWHDISNLRRSRDYSKKELQDIMMGKFQKGKPRQLTEAEADKLIAIMQVEQQDEPLDDIDDEALDALDELNDQWDEGEPQ